MPAKKRETAERDSGSPRDETENYRRELEKIEAESLRYEIKLPEFSHECTWFRAWRADNRRRDHVFLPRSEGQGKQLAREKYSPLLAQIAVFFGAYEPTLETLQKGVMRIKDGEAFICEACGRDIHNEGHLPDCLIVNQYRFVMMPPPPIILR